MPSRADRGDVPRGWSKTDRSKGRWSVVEVKNLWVNVKKGDRGPEPPSYSIFDGRDNRVRVQKCRVVTGAPVEFVRSWCPPTCSLSLRIVSGFFRISYRTLRTHTSPGPLPPKTLRGHLDSPASRDTVEIVNVFPKGLSSLFLVRLQTYLLTYKCRDVFPLYGPESRPPTRLSVRWFMVERTVKPSVGSRPLGPTASGLGVSGET